MPRLLIQVGSPTDPAAALSSLRRLTGRPILELKRALTDGTLELEFIADQNDHDEVATRVRDVLGTLASLGITPTIFELYGDLDLNSQSPRSLISAEHVENLLIAWEETRQALQREDDLRPGNSDDG